MHGMHIFTKTINFRMFYIHYLLYLFTAKLVDKFRVDGIPHIAFITKDARVETALIGIASPTLIE